MRWICDSGLDMSGPSARKCKGRISAFWRAAFRAGYPVGIKGWRLSVDAAPQSAEGESHAKAPQAGGDHGQHESARMGICLRNRLKGVMLVRGCPLKITACALYRFPVPLSADMGGSIFRRSGPADHRGCDSIAVTFTHPPFPPVSGHSSSSGLVMASSFDTVTLMQHVADGYTFV